MPKCSHKDFWFLGGTPLCRKCGIQLRYSGGNGEPVVLVPCPPSHKDETYCIVEGCQRPEFKKIGTVPFCKKHFGQHRPADPTGLYLAYYTRPAGFGDHGPSYAANLPKPPGDWGTTKNRLFDLPLNAYWLRRWKKYCREGRDQAHWLPWTNPE